MSVSEKQEYNLKTAAAKAESKRQNDLAKEKNAINRRAAIYGKAAAIAEASINTALAIARAFKDFIFPISAAVAAGVGALGAVQIGAIIATPLPRLAAGGLATGATQAIIGEQGGKGELIFPLESTNGRNALALLSENLLNALENKMSRSQSRSTAQSQQSTMATISNPTTQSNGGFQIVQCPPMSQDSLFNMIFKGSQNGDLFLAKRCLV